MEHDDENSGYNNSLINLETFNAKCVVSNPEDEKQGNSKNDKQKNILSTDKSKKSPENISDNSKIKNESKSAHTGTAKESKNETSKLSDSLCPSSKKKDNSVSYTVPKVNCMEKIIICLDMSSEMTELPFKLGDGSQFSPLCMVKRTIEIFIHNKSIIDRKHEFALVALYETATWVKEFTSDPKEFIDTLEDLDETTKCNSCDLSSLFALLGEKFAVGFPIKAVLAPPPYIYRVILIYGRSNCMPHFTEECAVAHILREYPYLFFDVLYIHEPPSNENRCQEIFEALCDLDEKYKSYIFEVTRNTTRLHNCMAKLLAHPLQRPVQKDAFYKVVPIEEP